MLGRTLRDVEYERCMLAESARIAGVPAAAFVERVVARLDERGPDLRVMRPEEMLGVLERQAIDLAGWAVICAQALAAGAFLAERPQVSADLLSLMRALSVTAAGVAHLIDPVEEQAP